MWELRGVPALAARWKADVVVGLSGVALPGVKVPQVVFAANPRPIVAVPFRERDHWLKHPVQRLAYRASARRAALTVFNSAHLRGLHARYVSTAPSPSLVVPHGLSGTTFTAARGRPERSRLGIVAASVWSRYKGPETLVDAISLVRGRLGIPTTLTLVGPWQDRKHRSSIEGRVRSLSLGESVEITGFVSRDRLHSEYAAARLFVLPSHTESFGLPALEAQAFGTPTVGSSTTAMPEVCGAGGVYCEPGQSEVLAQLIAQVLDDQCLWERMSAEARANARRHTWASAAAPLVDLLHQHAGARRAPFTIAA